jgi:CHAD domain-containing protein
MALTGGIAERFAVPGVGPATPVSRAAPAILAHKAAPIFELAQAAASGTDADAVHDMRVASRRTREALTLLEPYYPGKPFEKWSGAARAVTRVLGRVRDADVMLEEFSALASRARLSDERVTLAWLVGYGQGRRVASVRKMRRRLSALDLGGERARFERFAQRVRQVPGAREPLDALAAVEIGARVTALYAHLPAAGQEDQALAQHAMRIDAKRLRYCVETFAPCFGPGLEELYPMLKGLQDELGELHDRDVFADAVGRYMKGCDLAAAGVTPKGVEIVLADLAKERHARFVAFTRIVREWPEARMRTELLEALVQLPSVVEVPGS